MQFELSREKWNSFLWPRVLSPRVLYLCSEALNIFCIYHVCIGDGLFKFEFEKCDANKVRIKRLQWGSQAKSMNSSLLRTLPYFGLVQSPLATRSKSAPKSPCRSVYILIPRGQSFSRVVGKLQARADTYCQQPNNNVALFFETRGTSYGCRRATTLLHSQVTSFCPQQNNPKDPNLPQNRDEALQSNKPQLFIPFPKWKREPHWIFSE